MRSTILDIIGQRCKIINCNEPTRGILYIATGEKYIRAAIRSAQTVRKICPDIAIHFYGDWQNYRFQFEDTPYPFSSVDMITDPHRRSKVDYMSCTPFDQTLYLDTDTALNMDISELFGVLERFDIAVAHAHRRNDPSCLSDWRIELPKAFPQYNSGVFLYRRTAKVIRFLEEWRDSFKEAGFLQDQVTLRELLWLSDLRIATLPPEYNVRFIKYHYIWSKSEATTKIFHLQRLHIGWLRWIFSPWFRRLLRLMKRLGRNPSASWFKL